MEISLASFQSNIGTRSSPAILDRLVHNAHRLTRESLRKAEAKGSKA
jgi:hypothetical protein